MPTDPHGEIAAYITKLLNQSTAPIAEHSNVNVAMAWLKSISDGKLIITKAEDVEAKVAQPELELVPEKDA